MTPPVARLGLPPGLARARVVDRAAVFAERRASLEQPIYDDKRRYIERWLRDISGAPLVDVLAQPKSPRASHESRRASQPNLAPYQLRIEGRPCRVVLAVSCEVADERYVLMACDPKGRLMVPIEQVMADEHLHLDDDAWGRIVEQAGEQNPIIAHALVAGLKAVGDLSGLELLRPTRLRDVRLVCDSLEDTQHPSEEQVITQQLWVDIGRQNALPPLVGYHHAHAQWVSIDALLEAMQRHAHLGDATTAASANVGGEVFALRRSTMQSLRLLLRYGCAAMNVAPSM